MDRENLEFAITFILLSHFIESMGLFDIFKDKDEDEGSGGMAEETPSFESEPEPKETPSTEPAEETTSYSQPAEETPSTEPSEETTSYSQTGTAVQSQLGIEGLMDKRFKLEEAIDYDTQDLVSKTGKIWAFSVDAPVQYSLLTPKDSVIIEMSNFPLSMQVDNEQSHLTFPPGQTNISYYISTLASAQSTQPIPEDATDNSLILYAGIITAIGIAAIIAIKKSRSSKAIEPSVTIQKEEQPKPQSLDPEAIFKIKRDLREDDKEIINFISANGGQAYESELRKKFLQPRTTMWRAVKRLERQGIIEIEKKDLQNIVKLKSKLEDS